jgi:hypothetical protein
MFTRKINLYICTVISLLVRLCGLVAEFLATDPEVSGSIPGTTTFLLEVGGLERGPLSLVRKTEELLE